MEDGWKKVTEIIQGCLPHLVHILGVLEEDRNHSQKDTLQIINANKYCLTAYYVNV